MNKYNLKTKFQCEVRDPTPYQMSAAEIRFHFTSKVYFCTKFILWLSQTFFFTKWAWYCVNRATTGTRPASMLLQWHIIQLMGPLYFIQMIRGSTQCMTEHVFFFVTVSTCTHILYCTLETCHSKWALCFSCFFCTDCISKCRCTVLF